MKLSAVIGREKVRRIIITRLLLMFLMVQIQRRIGKRLQFFQGQVKVGNITADLSPPASRDFSDVALLQPLQQSTLSLF